MFNADRFRRWLAGVILPPERWRESATSTLTSTPESETDMESGWGLWRDPETGMFHNLYGSGQPTTSVAKLTPVFTPTGPRVRVKRVRKPKKTHCPLCKGKLDPSGSCGWCRQPLAKQPKAKPNRNNRKGRPKNPRDL